VRLGVVVDLLVSDVRAEAVPYTARQDGETRRSDSLPPRSSLPTLKTHTSLSTPFP
jgi:hypothetical protein